MEFIAYDSKTGLFLCWTTEVMSWKCKSKHVSLWKRLFGVAVSPNNIQNHYTHASNAYHLVTVYCWCARDVTTAMLVVKKLYFHVNSSRKKMLRWPPTWPPRYVVADQDQVKFWVFWPNISLFSHFHWYRILIPNKNNWFKIKTSSLAWLINNLILLTCMVDQM